MAQTIVVANSMLTSHIGHSAIMDYSQYDVISLERYWDHINCDLMRGSKFMYSSQGIVSVVFLLAPFPPLLHNC